MSATFSAITCICSNINFLCFKNITFNKHKYSIYDTKIVCIIQDAMKSG